VITVFPVERSSVTNSEQTKKKVMSSIEPVTARLKIRNLRKIRNNGILIETKTKEDLNQILKSKKLEEVGLKTGLPNRIFPRIIIYDVPRDLNEDFLIEAVQCKTPKLWKRHNLQRNLKYYLKQEMKRKMWQTG